MVLLQVTLGVLTIINSTVRIPVTLAVIHQFVAMLLLAVMFLELYVLSGGVSLPEGKIRTETFPPAN